MKGGKREGAGRKRGIPNKATAKKAAEIAESGLTPLDYMLQLMRNEESDGVVRFEAAKAAAPYVHPRLAATEHTGKDGGPIETKEVSDMELAMWMRDTITRAVHH